MMLASSPITVGRDCGNELEVVSGLTTRDQLILQSGGLSGLREPVRVASSEGSVK